MDQTNKTLETPIPPICTSTTDTNHLFTDYRTRKTSQNDSDSDTDQCSGFDEYNLNLSAEPLQLHVDKNIDENFNIKCQEVLRRQIRETNHELLELERKLRGAYIGKSLKQQINEKKEVELKDKLREFEENELELKEQLKTNENLKKIVEEERQQQRELKNTLLEQIKHKQLQNQYLYEEFLKEKRQLDLIIQRLQTEQEEELQEKILKKELARQDMDDYRKEQQLWQTKQKQEMEDENKRISEYLEQQNAKLEHIKQLKEIAQQRELEEYNRMSIEAAKKLKEDLNREELVWALQQAELNEAQDVQEKENLENSLRKRINFRLALDQQMLDIITKHSQEKQDDNEFQRNQMELLAERDRIEQLTNEKRRQKIIEHHRTVQKLLDQRRMDRKLELIELKKVQDQFADQEKRKQEIIEEERIKLLKQHACKLIGFLPSGVLRESDRDYLITKTN